MKCAYCEYNDGAVYASNPPKYRCSVTGEYHLALDDCNVEFAPIKHGRWIRGRFRHREKLEVIDGATCSECGAMYRRYQKAELGYDDVVPNYCPNCGAQMMDEVE